jgi:hypothetical protein
LIYTELRHSWYKYYIWFWFPISYIIFSTLSSQHLVHGFKCLNISPSYIQDKLQDIKEFECVIKNFLYCNTLYTVEECFNYNKKHIMKIFNTFYIMSVIEPFRFCLLNHYFNCLFLSLLLYSYYSSTCHWRILTKVLGYACKENCIYMTNSISHGADCTLWRLLVYEMNDDDDDDTCSWTWDAQPVVCCVFYTEE